MVDMKGLISKFPVEFQLGGFITMLIIFSGGLIAGVTSYETQNHRIESLEAQMIADKEQHKEYEKSIKEVEDNNNTIMLALVKIQTDIEYIKIEVSKNSK